jgi:hypothetical protein
VSVPFFKGPVIGVYNYQNEGEVNGTPAGSPNGTVLCAREPDTSASGSLLVAPCFLPNFAAGPYFVLAVGYSSDVPTTMSWAVVSGGQPSVVYPDGCTTPESGINGSGLWIFSRAVSMSATDLSSARAALSALGFTLERLIDVPQEGCLYTAATIKK